MSRRETMAHEFESGVMGHGKAAWHGLGTVVEGALTTAEAFEKSGLDWPGGVEKRRVFTLAATEIEEPVRRIEIPDKRAVVRVMDESVLGVVGDGYQVVQNVQMFDFLDALTAGEDKQARWESAGSLRGGRHVWGLLSLPDSQIKVGQDDELLPYLLITNAHDGSSSCKVIPTTVRVVCMNTLNAAVGGRFRELTVSIRHSGDIEHKLADARLMLARAGEMFGAFAHVANELAITPATRDTFDALVEELFPTPAEDAAPATKTRVENNRLLLAQAVTEERKLLSSPDMSHWTLLNGVTRFVDHGQRVQLRGREGNEARFEHSLLARGADVKEQAARKLIELAA